MQLSFAKGLMAGAAGVAVMLAITAAANGGVGAAFILGKINKVNATSTLTGTTTHPMLNVVNSGRGTALNLQVSKGHPPFTVNSSTKVANLNASMLGGIGPAGFVQGGGHVVTAEIELTVGQSNVPLFNLPGYGRFSVSCLSVPFAEVDFTVGPHKVHLWTQDMFGTSPSVSEQDMPSGSGLGFQTGVTATQIQWTIQDASSPSLSRHLATVQTDETVNGSDTSKCDFAAVAYAAP